MAINYNKNVESLRKIEFLSKKGLIFFENGLEYLLVERLHLYSLPRNCFSKAEIFDMKLKNVCVTVAALVLAVSMTACGSSSSTAASTSEAASAAAQSEAASTSAVAEENSASSEAASEASSSEVSSEAASSEAASSEVASSTAA